MKKALSILVISILVIVLSQIKVYGAKNGIILNTSVSISSSEVKKGEKVYVTVRFSKPVSTAELTVKYTSSKLKYITDTLDPSNSNGNGTITTC